MKLHSPGKRTRLAIFLLLVLILAGCGQKGDLYLPDRQLVETGVAIGV